MGFATDHHIGRTQILRSRLIETHDDGEFQRVSFQGLASQFPSKVGRSQTFGLTSHAPPGSIGHLLSISGRPDMTWALGFEHPSHRPRNTAAGHTVLYDAYGNTISVIGTKVRYVAPVHEFVGDIVITGNITQTGNFTQTGVHIDNNGPHTA